MFKFKKTNNIPDKELIASYKHTGDNYYIGELYKRYSHLVFAVCVKYLKDEDESKDAMMQIFDKMLYDLKKYQVDNFIGWLYKTARNNCLMKIRADQSLFAKTEELKKDYPVLMESVVVMHPDNDNEQEFYLDHLGKAVEHLADEQRICVELFYLKEKCYKEVAETTGFTMNEVKSYIQNGKRNMKIFIQNMYERQAK